MRKPLFVLVLMLLWSGWGLAAELADMVLLRQNAESGRAAAQFALAEAYHYGEGLPEDQSQAIKWYEKAAVKGHLEAQLALGYIYFGLFVTGEPEWEMTYGPVEQYNFAPFKWLEKAAAKDDPGAQLHLGYMYYYGFDVPKDNQQAVKWFQRAALQGQERAAYYLAMMYEDGADDVAQNYDEALLWYNRGLAARDPFTESRLGLMYLTGRGQGQDYAKALEHLQKAAGQYHDPALFALSFMYAFGLGVEQNTEEALEYLAAFQMAAYGNANAAINRDFRYGYVMPTQRDYALLADWLADLIAADVPAEFYLGLLYYENRGEGRNCAKALNLFEAAARRDEVLAQYYAGMLYYWGCAGTVKEDYAKALYWFEIAAEHGHAQARANAGDIFLEGKGVAKNSVMAYMWYVLADMVATGDVKGYVADDMRLLEKSLSTAEIKQAQQLVLNWLNANTPAE